MEPEIEVDEKTRNFSANIWLYLGNGTRETQINQSINQSFYLPKTKLPRNVNRKSYVLCRTVPFTK